MLLDQSMSDEKGQTCEIIATPMILVENTLIYPQTNISRIGQKSITRKIVLGWGWQGLLHIQNSQKINNGKIVLGEQGLLRGQNINIV